MSELSQRIVADLKEAMKARDQVTLNVVRSLKAAIQTVTIEKYGAAGELDEAEALAVVRKAIKQRQDAAASFREGQRQDLVEKEEVEIAILEKYLPAPLGQEEMIQMVEAVIAELGATTKKDMGAVMKTLQERTAGRADNKVLSQEVGKRLG